MRTAEGRSVLASRHYAYDNGVLRVTCAGSPPVLAIAGEIDESNYAGLVGALDKLANGHDEVHVNLAGVAFCDLAGLRAIIRISEPGSRDQDQARRRLVLHEVPRQIRRVLEIMGWDDMPGLVMPDAGGH